jgi:hypothetical protein
MTGRARRGTDRDTSTSSGSATLGSASAPSPSGEPTLDQLLAEPIVQQLMRRDQTNEATIRHLLQETAGTRSAWAKDDPNTDDSYTIGRLLHETARLWRRLYD